ncbi:MAG: DNA repair protein RecN, partial [Oscillospiraceae bacterium]|nr:DNA repair protein RecN [Oscillospiraceae bacterium]
RVILKDGKNVCRINGGSATVSMLKAVGGALINIHGQSDNQELMTPEKHIGIIDRLLPDREVLFKYIDAFDRMRFLKEKIRELNLDEAYKNRKIDLLSFQIGELEMADIKPGEKDDLAELKSVYQNSQKIISCFSAALNALSGGDDFTGANALVSVAAENIAAAAEHMPSLEHLSASLTDISYNLADIFTDLREMSESVSFSEDELADIDERLDLLYRLSKKYGETEEEMLIFLESAKKELDEINFSDETVAEYKKELEKVTKQAENYAEKLSKQRKTAAADFAKKIKNELAFLDMPGVVFEVRQEAVPLCENGADYVEFYISANAGEKPKPLSKTASGGELARIMLAIKNVFSEKDRIGTLIFDEVDSGVSGRAAGKVAMKLKEASKNRQVLCVTHLAQIAAHADRHLLIEKNAKKGKTYTSVTPLDFDGRARELARIASGENITNLQIQNAVEMLNTSIM